MLKGQTLLNTFSVCLSHLPASNPSTPVSGPCPEFNFTPASVALKRHLGLSLLLVTLQGSTTLTLKSSSLWGPHGPMWLHVPVPQTPACLKAHLTSDSRISGYLKRLIKIFFVQFLPPDPATLGSLLSIAAKHQAHSSPRPALATPFPGRSACSKMLPPQEGLPSGEQALPRPLPPSHAHCLQSAYHCLTLPLSFFVQVLSVAPAR